MSNFEFYESLKKIAEGQACLYSQGNHGLFISKGLIVDVPGFGEQRLTPISVRKCDYVIEGVEAILYNVDFSNHCPSELYISGDDMMVLVEASETRQLNHQSETSSSSNIGLLLDERDEIIKTQSGLIRAIYESSNMQSLLKKLSSTILDGPSEELRELYWEEEFKRASEAEHIARRIAGFYGSLADMVCFD